MISPQILLNGILTGGIYCLVAIGLTLCLGVMRLVNLAQGAFAVLSAYLSYELAVRFRLDPFLSLFVIFPFFFLVGFIIYPTLIEYVVLKSGSERMALVATLGLMYLIDGFSLLVWGGDPRSIPTPYTLLSIDVGILVFPFVRTICLIISLMLTAAMFVLLKRTFMGKAIRALILDRKTAQLMGVNTKFVSAVIFGFGVASASVAGVMTGIFLSFNPGVGFTLIIKGICATIVGGRDILGTCIAAYAIGLIEAISTCFIQASLVDVISFAVILAMFTVRPLGLRGVEAR